MKYDSKIVNDLIRRISNIPLNSPDLSLKAKGLWAYLASKPGGGQVSVSQLVNAHKDGETSIFAGIRELREAGYIVELCRGGAI